LEKGKRIDMKGTVETQQRQKPEPRPQTEYVLPEVNIFETKDGYTVEAEMPGVSKDGLEITLEGTEITIVGHRRNEPASGTPLFRERSHADFRRVFELDPAIDASKIAAKMEQGVLTLTLPKSEEVKPRRINVD
jgi:HSP20 family protein